MWRDGGESTSVLLFRSDKRREKLFENKRLALFQIKVDKFHKGLGCNFFGELQIPIEGSFQAFFHRGFVIEQLLLRTYIEEVFIRMEAEVVTPVDRLGYTDGMKRPLSDLIAELDPVRDKEEVPLSLNNREAIWYNKNRIQGLCLTFILLSV